MSGKTEWFLFLLICPNSILESKRQKNVIKMQIECILGRILFSLALSISLYVYSPI